MSEPKLLHCLDVCSIKIIAIWSTVHMWRCPLKERIHAAVGAHPYVVMQSKKNMFFFNKKTFKKKNIIQKNRFFMVFYYYLQFIARKVFFNTLECLFMLYTSCKTLHSVCQLHFHWFRDKLLNELQYKSP